MEPEGSIRVVRQATSNSFFAGFTCTDTDNLLKGGDKNLAVTNFAGCRGTGNRIDNRLYLIVAHRYFHFDLGQKIHHVLCTTIELSVAFLTTEAFYLGDGDTLHTDLRQSRTNIIQLERFYYSTDQFHDSVDTPISKFQAFNLCPEQAHDPLTGVNLAQCQGLGKQLPWQRSQSAKKKPVAGLPQCRPMGLALFGQMMPGAGDDEQFGIGKFLH